MDQRCLKYWEDAQELVRNAPATAKMLKELRTMSRFLQKNQSQRFSDNAQQKIVDAIATYVSIAKQHSGPPGAEQQQLAEATFQVVKDGLAMPFNVFGSKQKKRLLKWYNELIGVVGGDPDGKLQVEGLEETPSVEWSVLDIDDEGYLSLLNEATGETCESFQVKKKSVEYKKIKKAFENAEVVVVTTGDEIAEVRVNDE